MDRLRGARRERDHVHARQEMVKRLDSYELEFGDCSARSSRSSSAMMPIVLRHAISGVAHITEDAK